MTGGSRPFGRPAPHRIEDLADRLFEFRGRMPIERRCPYRTVGMPAKSAALQRSRSAWRVAIKASSTSDNEYYVNFYAPIHAHVARKPPARRQSQAKPQYQSAR